jgi:phage terminase large subunit
MAGLRTKTTIVHDYLTHSKTRITAMQGGTRSGKTYNIIKYFVLLLLTVEGKTLTVCRSSLNTIKGSVLRDFIEILLDMNLYDESFHNKTDQTYLLNGNLVEFISTDQPQKIRGRKRDYLFINECNEIKYDAWMQLLFRTNTKIVIDYNPSDEFHWIYDVVLTRSDCDFYRTTYLDNPFIPDDLIGEIERLKDADETYWRVYGLGERGTSKDTIYTHWREHRGIIPIGVDHYYGLDFGFNNPMALTKIADIEGVNYVQQMIYQTKMNTQDLIDEMKILGIGRGKEIYADPARPDIIEEIKRAGFNIHPANNEVFDGIQKVKSMPLRICEGSPDLLKEAKFYKWKVDKDNRKLDEPVKFHDHAMDSIRYGIFTRNSKRKATWAVMN